MVLQLQWKAVMDIARPELKVRKRRRQAIIIAVIVLCVAALSVAISRLKAAAPSVDRSTIWTDTVKRGSMLRQVRGLGSLIPARKTFARFPPKPKLPSFALSCPGLAGQGRHHLAGDEQSADGAGGARRAAQLKAAQAEYQSLRVKLESDLMNQKAGAATVNADQRSATPGADRQGALRSRRDLRLGLQASTDKAQEMTTRNKIEDERLTVNQNAIASQMAVQQAKVDQMRALAELKQKQLRRAESAGRSRWRAGGLAPAGRPACFARNDAGEDSRSRII